MHDLIKSKSLILQTYIFTVYIRVSFIWKAAISSVISGFTGFASTIDEEFEISISNTLF